jgi:hypothetical protein
LRGERIQRCRQGRSHAVGAGGLVGRQAGDQLFQPVVTEQLASGVLRLDDPVRIEHHQVARVDRLHLHLVHQRFPGPEGIGDHR